MTTQIVIAFVFGVTFIVGLMVLAVAFPKPTPFQYKVFRIVLSLAVAGAAAMVPGFINLEVSLTAGLLIRAGGALAVFVIVFFFNPAELSPGAAHRSVAEELVAENPTIGPVWERFDDDLQDAFALAANEARRQNKNYVSTRFLFAALLRLNVEPLPDLFRRIPKQALPDPIDETVRKDLQAIDSQTSFSGCVRDSLEKLSARVTRGQKISSEDVFVDIAKHGRGTSVKRLRANGVNAAKIDKIVNQLGWRVIERKRF